MASTETASPAADKVEEAPPPPPEVKTPVDAPPTDYLAVAEVVLRFLVFASALVAVVVIVTSKETQKAATLKFNHSPAFIYFVAAVSVTGLYSIITTLLSFYDLLQPASSPKFLLQYFVLFDVVLVGIVGAATGSAGAVAYTALKGNSHLGWPKICNVYDDFCTHVGASVAVSLFAAILLLLLVFLICEKELTSWKRGRKLWLLWLTSLLEVAARSLQF